MKQAMLRLTALLFFTALGISGGARAGMFNWEWQIPLISMDVQGTFSTPVTSGLITEADVTAHAYTVFFQGSPFFAVDLVAGTVDGDAATFNYHDFTYVIGNSRFESSNPFVNDVNFPVDLSVEIQNTLLGVTYYGSAAGDGWVLEIPQVPINERSTGGFASGPVITMVPEPKAYAMISVALGLIGWQLRRRLKLQRARCLS